jgi:DNA/RNA endonuclease YhcR with UshA esterase domain
VGHINLFNNDILVQRTDPRFDTLPELYGWLAANPTVIAQFNHPDPSYDGNFENFIFDTPAAPQLFLQEIGNHAQDYVTYEPAFVQSNAAGWQVSPTNNGDTHTANWGRDTIGRTGIVAPALTEADLLAALRARRVFSSEDANLALALRSHDVWMGSTLPPTESLSLTVDLADPDPEPATLYLYDGNLILATVSLATSTGQWRTTVAARPGHYFWAKLVQADGHRAYSTPLWIEGHLEPEPIVLNEILPAPLDNWDWDGNGTADYQDEYIELYNPLDYPVGLGGWRLMDESGSAYDIPLNVAIPAHGFSTFFATQTGLSLNNGGETVSLIHPNGALVDSFRYDHSPGYDESWCRLADGGGAWSDDCGPSPYEKNWGKPPPGPLSANIYEAKRLTRNAWVKVKGYVTVPPGLFGARTMYIQDGTAGIMVYLPKDHRLELQVGEKVEVEGNLRLFHGEWEIAVSNRSDVKSKGPSEPPPPLPIATTSLLEPYEGMLVMLQGQAVRFKGRTIFWVDDGTGQAKVYLRAKTGIRKPFIEPGTPVTVVGVVSQYSDKDNPSRNDYRLMPRFQTDLILPEEAESPPVPDNWPTMLPETGY